MKNFTFIVLGLYCLIFPVFGQQKMVQTVRGTVSDKSLKTPLPGATILVINTQPLLVTIADADGNFRLNQVPIGRQNILIKMMGYKELLFSNVEVNSGKECVLFPALEEDLREIDEVVVLGERDKYKANNGLAVISAISLRSAEINRFAGSRQDPSRMASNFAGVAGGGDQRNDIIVRGNSPWGVLWRLEGVDIPNPNHFAFTGNTGGAFSILNNNLLANSDFLTGAFPAEYGNKTAAVFDVRLRKGNNEKREHTAQLGLNGFEFATEGPISRQGGGSYLLSTRLFSFAALDALGVSIGANGVPQFLDGTFKIHLPTTKGGAFSIWGMGGNSAIGLLDKGENLDDPTVLERDQMFQSGMFATGLNWEHRWNEKSLGTVRVSYSGNSVSIDNKEIWLNKSSFRAFDLQNREQQAIASYQLTQKFSPRHTLKSGIIYRQQFFSNYSMSFDPVRDENVVSVDQKGNAGFFQAYSQWQCRISEGLTINPGLYFQQFFYNKTSALEPRISVAYQPGERDRFTLASGLHSQTAPLFLYQSQFQDPGSTQYRTQNRSLDFTRSLHLVAGYQRKLTENLYFKSEAYYQYQYDVPISMSHDTLASIYSILNFGADYGFYAFDSTVNKGKGKNYGVELSMEKFFSKGYYFLANLSLFRSRFTTADGVERNSVFDLGHVFNVLTGKEFHLDNENKKAISVDVKGTHSGGRRYLPVDVEASKRDNKTRYDLTRAYEPRLKDYFRADIKISYQINRPKANHNLFLAADNVLNTQNILAIEWNKKKGEVQTYYQLGVFPYLGYRVQF